MNTTELTPTPGQAVTTPVTDLTVDEVNAIVETMQRATPGTTARTYRSHVVAFAKYCSEHKPKPWAWVPGNAFVVVRDETPTVEDKNADHVVDETPTVEGKNPEPVVVEIAPTPARVDWVLAHLNHLKKTGASFATLDGRVRALTRWHKHYGFVDSVEPELFRPYHPAVWEWLKGARNEYAKLNADGKQLPKDAPGILYTDLTAMVNTCDTSTLAGLRDRCLLVLGHAGAFRRSELSAVVVENIEIDTQGRGLAVNVYNTKANKHGVQRKECPTQPNNTNLCPVTVLQEWLERANITDGLVFRPINKAGRVGTRALSARSVDKIVREYDERASVVRLAHNSKQNTDANGAPILSTSELINELFELGQTKFVERYQVQPQPAGFSGHSLRSGYATQATLDGVPDALIRAQGWADTSRVVFRYQRRAGVFAQRRAGFA